MPGNFRGKWRFVLVTLSVVLLTLWAALSYSIRYEAGRRHLANVSSVAFSPDNRTVATSGDGTTRLWELASGRELAAWRRDSAGETGSQSSYGAFADDIATLFAGSGSKELTQTVFSPSGDVLVVGSMEDDFGASARLSAYDLRAGAPLYSIDWDERLAMPYDTFAELERKNLRIDSVAFTSDGMKLAVAGFGPQSGRSHVALFDPKTGDQLPWASTSPESEQVVPEWVSRLNAMEVWRQQIAASAGRQVIPATHVQALRLIDGDSMLAAWEYTHPYNLFAGIGLWDVASSSLQSKLLAPDDEQAWKEANNQPQNIPRDLKVAAISGDVKLVAARSPDGAPRIQVTERSTGQVTSALAYSPAISGGGDGNGIPEHPDRLLFSPDGDYLAAGWRFVGRGGRLRIWNLTDQNASDVPLSGRVGELAFTPDGTSVVASTYVLEDVVDMGLFAIRPVKASEIVVCDAASGQVRHRLPGPTKAKASIALSPDGKVLATWATPNFGAQQPSELRLSDLATGAPHLQLRPALTGLTWLLLGLALLIGTAEWGVLRRRARA